MVTRTLMLIGIKVSTEQIECTVLPKKQIASTEQTEMVIFECVLLIVQKRLSLHK